MEKGESFLTKPVPSFSSSAEGQVHLLHWDPLEACATTIPSDEQRISWDQEIQVI